jgi:hypothetical protein
MKFHYTQLGVRPDALRTDREGFVTCSPERVKRARAAIERGHSPDEIAKRYGQTNTEVAEVERQIDAWRKPAEES